jgi:hypothetical protein
VNCPSAVFYLTVSIVHVEVGIRRISGLEIAQQRLIAPTLDYDATIGIFVRGHVFATAFAVSHVRLTRVSKRYPRDRDATCDTSVFEPNCGRSERASTACRSSSRGPGVNEIWSERANSEAA